jgi:hypothetical protein
MFNLLRFYLFFSIILVFLFCVVDVSIDLIDLPIIIAFMF